jgi:hypothetical protein
MGIFTMYCMVCGGPCLGFFGYSITLFVLFPSLVDERNQPTNSEWEQRIEDAEAEAEEKANKGNGGDDDDDDGEEVALTRENFPHTEDGDGWISTTRAFTATLPDHISQVLVYLTIIHR